MANALAYVLLNFLHHFPEEAARTRDLRDPFSSAWREPGTDPPVVRPRTWLLDVGWRRCAAHMLLTNTARAAGDETRGREAA